MEVRQRRAFQFIGKAGKTIETIAARKVLSKTNIVLLAIDTASEVIQAGISYMNYRFEKQQTERLRQEIAAAKERVDQVVEEEKQQLLIMIEQKRARMISDLELYKLRLQAESEKVVKEIDQFSKKSQNEFEEGLKALNLQHRLRKPIKKILDYAAGLIDAEIKKPDYDEETLMKLQEDYRNALRNYQAMIEQVV
jgi:hypothetical protein